MITGKCPCCEQGQVFYQAGNLFTFSMPKMHKNCPNCGHHFEIEPGFFFGAMYISYALTVFEAGMVILFASFFTGNLFDTRVIWPVLCAIPLLTFPNYRLSRMMWMYLFTSKQSQ